MTHTHCIPKIIRNLARCGACHEEIESKHRHDMRWCKCGATAVDGGTAYLKRTYGPARYEELSVCDPPLGARAYDPPYLRTNDVAGTVRFEALSPGAPECEVGNPARLVVTAHPREQSATHTLWALRLACGHTREVRVGKGVKIRAAQCEQCIIDEVFS